MNAQKIIYWLARILAALIMLQTLFFKFTGASESIEIFTKMGMEPWGRFGSGVMELVASILLLVNPMAKWGAVLGAGLMAGAIGSHLFVLGIEVQGDGGYLFFLACAVLVCSIYVLWVNKADLLALIGKK